MADRYWFAPETEETSFLGALEVSSELCVEVRVVRNLYRNKENGYSVYDVEDAEHHWFKISGFIPSAMKIDSYYSVRGVVKDGKYGRTLQISDYHSALPQDEIGIINVLRTLPRLDTRAPAIYQALGEEALMLILEDPKAVASKVKWVGEEDAVLWQRSLRAMKESDIILETLQRYQIPIDAAKQLIEKYPDIIERLKRSPYFLSEEIRGFSFPKCDSIALENDYPVYGEERLQHAMLYVLNQDARRHGNCYMDKQRFLAAVKNEVNIRIDYRTAQRLLARGGICEFTVSTNGTNIIKVDRKKLEEAMKLFRSHPGTGRFSFTCVEVGDVEVQRALEGLRTLNRIVEEDNRIYLGHLYEAEVSVSRRLKAMVASEYSTFEDTEKVMEDVCREEGIILEDSQRVAVIRICSCRGGVFVLNGRAGCGKTFTLNIIIKVLERLYKKQGLHFSAKIMAPTGKAAQVAHHSTGLPSSTVHKALHLVTDHRADSMSLIGGECIVVDEFSMMGLSLTASLFKSISAGVKTIILGDYEQLPSIDPGNVLRDIIQSAAVPVITLNVVKRQAEGSGVLHNANQILEGNEIRSMIVNKGKIQDNAFIYKTESPMKCRDEIVGMVLNIKKRGYRLDDIQVLCPQKKTDVGIDSLNYYLQAKLNPGRNRKELLYKNVEIHDESGTLKTVRLMFREGDKVIHVANDYAMKFYRFQKGLGFVEDITRVGIVNGETGRIARITEIQEGNTTHQRLYVKYGENQYALYEDNWSDLAMAYAMTIHRAQGSQWPVIIAPILLCNQRMLSRGILYTLYTRAQEASIIYGSEASLKYAIAKNPVIYRNSRLKERLCEQK